MTRDEAFADLQAAMADYGIARKSLAHHRGLAKHGLANGLMHAVAAEHSAFHRLERAQAAYAKLQPPASASKPTAAPKPVATSTTPAKIAPPVAVKTNPTASATSAFDLLGHLNDRCDASEARWMARYGLKPQRNS